MDKLLTLEEASQVMRISYSKAQKLAKAGAFPFKKVGCSWMIPRSALYAELDLELPDDEGGSSCVTTDMKKGAPPAKMMRPSRHPRAARTSYSVRQINRRRKRCPVTAFSAHCAPTSAGW